LNYVSAFYRYYNNSRIFYTSGGAEIREGDPGYTTAIDTLNIYAMGWKR